MSDVFKPNFPWVQLHVLAKIHRWEVGTEKQIGRLLICCNGTLNQQNVDIISEVFQVDLKDCREAQIYVEVSNSYLEQSTLTNWV